MEDLFMSADSQSSILGAVIGGCFGLLCALLTIFSQYRFRKRTRSHQEKVDKFKEERAAFERERHEKWDEFKADIKDELAEIDAKICDVSNCRAERTSEVDAQILKLTESINKVNLGLSNEKGKIESLSDTVKQLKAKIDKQDGKIEAQGRKIDELTVAVNSLGELVAQLLAKHGVEETPVIEPEPKPIKKSRKKS